MSVDTWLLNYWLLISLELLGICPHSRQPAYYATCSHYGNHPGCTTDQFIVTQHPSGCVVDRSADIHCAVWVCREWVCACDGVTLEGEAGLEVGWGKEGYVENMRLLLVWLICVWARPQWQSRSWTDRASQQWPWWTWGTSTAWSTVSWPRRPDRGTWVSPTIVISILLWSRSCCGTKTRTSASRSMQWKAHVSSRVLSCVCAGGHQLLPDQCFYA